VIAGESRGEFWSLSGSGFRHHTSALRRSGRRPAPDGSPTLAAISLQTQKEYAAPWEERRTVAPATLEVDRGDALGARHAVALLELA
jgi:hypothetical protein